jgi:hypothetical protein
MTLGNLLLRASAPSTGPTGSSLHRRHFIVLSTPLSGLRAWREGVAPIILERVGFLGDQREQRRLKAVIKRDGALLNEMLAAYTEQVGTFEPEFGPHHVAALRAAMVGAASSLVQLRARVSTSEDISAIAGGLDSATGTYRAGLYPAATLRDAPEGSLEPLFRILTWAHMTDVISEFWWPDYYWETARVAVMFGIRGPGERLMIAYGPDPGSVFHQADLTVEYSLAKMRGALCAMVDELTDKRTADDDLWIDMLLHNWWSEAFMAGSDEMGVTLKEASPDGYSYTVGVAEAREGKEFQHSPPPRMDEDAIRDVEGAWTLCEQGLSLVGDYPSENDPLYEDIAALMDAYVHDVAKAGGAEDSTSVTEAILAGYLAAEAEHKQGLGRPEGAHDPVTLGGSGREHGQLLVGPTQTFDLE